VACDPGASGVRYAVELDDNTHAQSRRQNRDHIVDKVLDAAGIPVIHVIAKKGYSVQDIQAALSGGDSDKDIKRQPNKALSVGDTKTVITLTASLIVVPY
jgi:hypothetical protein